MRFHIDMEAADRIRSGVAPAEANRAARVAFGGLERHKEAVRDQTRARVVEDGVQDTSYALRQLRASPGFALATLLTLGLGIGATTAMYSITHLVFHQPLAFPRLDRLVIVRQMNRMCSGCGSIALGNYIAVRDGAPSLSSVSAMHTWTAVLRVDAGAEAVRAARVTPDFFATLGSSTIIGRPLLAADTALDRRDVVVLSENAWRARFRADSSVIGRIVIVDARPVTIVGVLAAKYTYPAQTELWTPLVMSVSDLQARSFADAHYTAIARLADGASLDRAAAELRVLADRAAKDLPPNPNGLKFAVSPLAEWTSVHGEQLDIFDAAVTLVLLIACINLTGLLVARLTARRRELAVRAAIGAGSGRIARQVLTESVLVALMGGVLGAVLANWGIAAIRDAVPLAEAAQVPGWENLHLDLRGLGLAFMTALATGLLIGVWPALRSARRDPLGELKTSPHASTGSGQTTRGRRLVVTAEIAVTIVLLTAAGLLTRTARNASRAPMGFRGDHVLTMRLQLPQLPRGAPGDPTLFDDLVEGLRSLPGVEAVAAGSGIPFNDNTTFVGFELETTSSPSGRAADGGQLRPVTADYFNVLAIPLIAGRTFAGSDGTDAPRVVVVNKLMVARHFKDRDPMGTALTIDTTRYVIVGVVGDVSYNGAQQHPEVAIYYPMQQGNARSATIAVRVSGDPTSYASALVRAIHGWSRDVAVGDVRTMDQVAGDFNSVFRLMAAMMLAFACAAVVISAIGLYAIMSYSVAQRTREFGVRLALGADRRALLRLVLGEGLGLAGSGMVVGVFGALLVTRLMRSLLYGVSPSDPFTLTVVCASACALVVAAAYLPARRATRVDPVRSLRAE
jgi:putative ABC transport system permease protein